MIYSIVKPYKVTGIISRFIRVNGHNCGHSPHILLLVSSNTGTMGTIRGVPAQRTAHAKAWATGGRTEAPCGCQTLGLCSFLLVDYEGFNET